MSSISLFRSGMTLSIGSIIGALCSFLRNILIARLISVEDFGIAATFALAMSLIEMTSSLAIDRLIVQSEDGENPTLQGTAQAFEVLRGLLNGVLLFLLATPVSILFELHEQIWAYQLLAVVPVVRGFAHLDHIRFQRNMRFLPAMLIIVLPQVITLIAAPILALEFKDYRLMLWVILGQVILSVLLSHIFAKRRYNWAWDKSKVYQIFNFGWPLMLNGFLLYGVFQADKAIVGSAIGIHALGWFSAAFTLTLFPSMILARVCQSFLLPLLSKDQTDDIKFLDGVVATLQICGVFGTLLAVGIAIGGPSLLVTLFGARYSAGTEVIVWLGLMQGLRLIKAGPVIAAMARGITTLPLQANLVRSIAIPMALFSIWMGWGVMGVAISGVIGEAMASSYSLLLLRVKLKLKIDSVLIKLFLSSVSILAVMAASNILIDGSRPVLELGSSILAMPITFGLYFLLMPEFLRWLKKTGQVQNT